MQLGWIDFSKEDRKKVLSVIDLLSEDGTLDELGIALIRDGFADLFFPGTSTIQTRAKYFLLVPYAVDSILHEPNTSPQRILEKLDAREEETARELMNLNVDGVIGSRSLRSGKWVKRTPSDIYWAGLRRYGIFQGGSMSLPEFVRTAFAIQKNKESLRKSGIIDEVPDAEGDDTDAGSFYSRPFWKLPSYDRSSWMENLFMDLTVEEAEFLKNQIILTQPDSLMAQVLKGNIKEFLSLTSFYEIEAILPHMPPSITSDYYMARSFSDFILLARIRYNIILSEGRNERAMRLWAERQHDLSLSSDLDLDGIFTRLGIRNLPLRQFLLKLQHALLTNQIQEADQIIIQREKALKGINRAKLSFPGKYPEDRMIGGAGLDYRFYNGRTILTDLFAGLEADDAQTNL